MATSAVKLPSWNDIRGEMVAAGQDKGTPLDLDGVRRQKIAAVEAITGRPLVIYAVDLMGPHKTAHNPILTLLNLSDKDGFIEATRRIEGENLDILIQSPGGLAEAVESIVAILRARYTNIRFIIPSTAKSAATMLALSGNQIVGSVTTELGPIDPQMPTGRGGFAPAQAILDQFDHATTALKKDPSAMPAWLPILQFSSTRQPCYKSAGTDRPSQRLWCRPGYRRICSVASPTPQDMRQRSRPSSTITTRG